MVRILLPFMYFAFTRLTGRRAILFHASYEWIPGIALAYLWGGSGALSGFFISYLAFISIYELGYVMNDEMSHRRAGERQRHTKQSPSSLSVMVGVRLAVFIPALNYLGQSDNRLTLAGYAALVLSFLIHNLLRSASLKCISFLLLSFLRFLLPLAPWLSAELLMVLTAPVLLNYCFFRLLIYMDSKKLLNGFDRKTPGFLVGYYLMAMMFGAMLSQASSSWLPAGFALYYLGLSVIMAVTLSMRR
jgi:hypothetical protein